MLRHATFLIVAGAMLTSLVALAEPTAHYHSGWSGAVLPDPEVTPGATRPVTTEEVCTPGSPSAARNVPPEVKRQVYATYGVRPTPGVCCEVDHLVSLELGGSNDIANLWPQPYEPRPGAHEKDHLENFLHRAVCGGAMTLEEAQQKIRTDWSEAYREMRGIRP